MKTDIKQNFSLELIACLEKKYNKKPSAQFFANNYNAKTGKKISKETARKWMSGLSLPEPNRMKDLMDWLNLDTQNIFKTNNANTEQDIFKIQFHIEDLEIENTL
jgi:hypothetical protein